MRTNPLRLPLALALTLGAALLAGSATALEVPDPPPRPDYMLADLDGELREAADWDGQVVLLNFWATWCAPCREEMPELRELSREYREQGLTVVGIATLDDQAAVQEFVDQLDIRYPILVGMDEAMEVAQQYGNNRATLPYTVLVDRAGRVRHVFAKKVSRAELEPLIRELL